MDGSAFKGIDTFIKMALGAIILVPILCIVIACLLIFN